VTDTTYRHSIVAMGTVVTIQVAGPLFDDELAHRAFEWFRGIETTCTRFDPSSELMQLTNRVGEAVPVSTILFQAIQFALAVAKESGGAFDPTVGHLMESYGFNTHHRSGNIIRTEVAPAAAVSYRDVLIDSARGTVMLQRPLVLDLGAVAKGLAIDLAARELKPLENFAVDAGGDLYLAGVNHDGKPWSVGIRHPYAENELLGSISVSDRAVCTSGNYERPDHILDARTGKPTHGAASVTVVGATAMLADALATAAFVLGPEEGIQLLSRLGVEGIIFSTSLERYATAGMNA
jgi:thiamine biosynthesis lipoprotein